MEKSIFPKKSNYQKYTDKGRQALDKTIYIISDIHDSPHISNLLKHLVQNSIHFQIQDQKHQLLSPIVEDGASREPVHRFIVVDNKDGVVKLGRYFAVTEMFVVGYPKIGPNPKNHYCTREEDVVRKYRKFLKENENIKNSSISRIKFSKSFNKSQLNSQNSMPLNSKVNPSKKGTKEKSQKMQNCKPIKQIKIQNVELYSEAKNNDFQPIKKMLYYNPKIFKQYDQNQTDSNNKQSSILITQWKSLHSAKLSSYHKVYCLCDQNQFGDMLCSSPSNTVDKITYFQTQQDLMAYLHKYIDPNELQVIMKKKVMSSVMKSPKPDLSQNNITVEKVKTNSSEHDASRSVNSSLTFSNTQMPINSMWYTQDEIKNDQLVYYHRHLAHHARTERIEHSEIDPSDYFPLKSQKYAKIDLNLEKKDNLKDFSKKNNEIIEKNKVSTSKSLRVKRILSEVKNTINIQIENKNPQTETPKKQNGKQLKISNLINTKEKENVEREYSKCKFVRSKSLQPKIRLSALKHTFNEQKPINKKIKSIIQPLVQNLPQRKFNQNVHKKNAPSTILNTTEIDKFFKACHFSEQFCQGCFLWFKNSSPKIQTIVDQLTHKNLIQVQKLFKLCSPFQQCISTFVSHELERMPKRKNENFSFKKITDLPSSNVLLLIDEQDVLRWVRSVLTCVKNACTQTNESWLSMKIVIVNKTNSQIFFQKKLESLKSQIFEPFQINLEIFGIFLNGTIQTETRHKFNDYGMPRAYEIR